MWLADHLRGKDVLLLAGSNAEAADLSRRVQAKLTQLGTVGPPQAPLSDGNHAGVGDLVRARLNTEIDADGRPLTNRDTLQITAFRGPDAEVRRQRLDGTWTGTFRVPRAYLAASAELAYAGNVHVAQGRTVDTAHLLVTESLSRQALYVGMTRGRQSNTAHVVTGNTAPPGHQPYQQATPEAVLAGIMQRDDGDLSATEQIRQAQDWAGGTGHLLTLWSAAIRQTLHPDIDQQIKARLTDIRSLAVRPRALPPGPAPAAPRRPARRARHQRPHRPDHRRADGPAPGPSPASCTAACSGSPCPTCGTTRPGRSAHPPAPRRSPTSSPPPSTTGPAPSANSLAASPEPWLARHLGVLAPGASPALREEYTRRAGTAAAYREAAGITNPDQAVSPEPHRGNPELEAMRKAVLAALEIRDEADILRGLDRGELEARVLHGQRARAAAPPDVSSQLRLTAQAEADALQQSADARTQHDHTGRGQRHSPRRPAGRRTPAPRSRQRPLRAMVRRHPRHQGHGRESHSRTATARARPARRNHIPAGGEPQLMAGWWQQLEADAEAVNCADASEHQAASNAGPRPPQRVPDMNPPSAPKPEPQTSPENEPAQQNQARGSTSC